FDPDLYPTGSGDISLQKTRRILSPFIPIRTADGLTLNNTSIDTSNWPNYENGNGAFPNPKERILKQFKLYPSWRAGQYGGLLQPYLWAIEVQDSVETRLYGQLPAVDPQAGPNYVSIDSSNPIIQINMDTWKTPPQGASGWNTNLMRGSVSGLSFLQRDGTRLSAGMGGGFADTIYSLPATHYLSYLYGTPYQTSDNYSGHVGALVGVSTPQEATLPNIIGQPDEQGNVSTMGFPFEKASYGGTVVKEWLNGANAMKLSPGQSIGIPITNVTSGEYQIRCRYASNDNTNVFFNVDTGGANPIFQQINFASTVDNNTGVQGANGVYVVKSIATTDNSFTEIPAKTINVHLTNQGSSDVFLDRIEFIPFSLPLIYHGSYNTSSGADDVLWSSSNMNYYDIIVNGQANSSSIASSMHLLNKGKVIKTIDIPGHSETFFATFPVPEGFNEVRILAGLPEVSGNITVQSNNPPQPSNNGGGDGGGNGGGDGGQYNFSLSGSDHTTIYHGKLETGIHVQGNYTYTGTPVLILNAYRNNTVVSSIPVYSPFDITIQTEADSLELELQPRYGFATVNGTATVKSPNVNYDRSFKLPIDLQNITTQVNALFASGTQNMLAHNVSDHDIEEVVLKVDALSDEVFGDEKKALRKLVNQAKRLSRARNLLIGGSFENWDAWYKGRNVVTVSDHELFKSDHVLLPPPGLSPSYIFQKVEESKLKANTRYTVSGFIAHATDLEIVVSRYGQEIKKVVQVPYGEAFPLTSSGPVCCIPHSTSNGTLGNPHFFSYSIDVGALDVDTNPGIEFGLRIVNPTGMARVSNLEIREDRPLAANEIRQVQRVARNWRTEYEKERAEVTSLIQPVINRINGLYDNGNWNGSIRSDISYHNIDAIVLPTLPKLRHWFMSDRFSEQGDIMAKFQGALNRAYAQLEQNTLLHNGHFTKDAANWTVEGDAHQVVLEDGKRVLRLPDWSSSVSQTIEIENFDPDKEYQLVFHGQGEGT
ncbi:delta endotoxin C-terminal domain-containing protein, partial [Bacillus thuringiensis]|uniref:delta endotoxin C-terminal domain-containing protein n=1 Tax=Bacillus thuringiensis TaxID=1428 RepID=UPI000BECEF13